MDYKVSEIWHFSETMEALSGKWETKAKYNELRNKAFKIWLEDLENFVPNVKNLFSSTASTFIGVFQR